MGAAISVDITEGQTFVWRRWMSNIRGPSLRNMIGKGIAKMFVVAAENNDQGIIACCRVDGTYMLRDLTVGDGETRHDWTNGWVLNDDGTAIHKDWMKHIIMCGSPWVVPHNWMVEHHGWEPQ